MVEINNLSRIKINEKVIKIIAETVLRKEKKRLDLSIALVDSSKIKNLNSKYRKKNQATDVLSFLYDSFGEIIICPQIIKKNVKRLKENFEKELIMVLIHGILHLLGYDHELSLKKAEEMEKKQNRYLKLCQSAAL